MAVQAQDQLEAKIIELRTTLSKEQWSDADFLLTKVTELENTDIALAFRLMQRVRNIQPSKSNKSKLTQLRKHALLKHPELATTSSTDTSERLSVLSKTQGLIKTFGKNNPTLLNRLLQPFVGFVLIPFFVFCFYQLLIASDRYESQTQLIVKEPNASATLDPAMAFMSGLGMPSAGMDAPLVQSYIQSTDMLTYLDSQLNLLEHYSDTQYDYFSRLSGNASRESQLTFFLKMITIEIDPISQVITVKAQAFESDMAHILTQMLQQRAEWYINEISRNLAKRQLSFVEQEHETIQQKLKEANATLLDFQRRYNLLDPEAEGMALQQISYQLEAQISAKKAELRTLSESMSSEAPMVLNAQNELNSLIKQLSDERNRLTDPNNDTTSQSNAMGVNQILSKYSDHKINLELALQAYTSSLVSLEKSRIEAYRQIKYLVTVESPTLPEDASYPRVFYNVSLFLVIILILFGIFKIVIATVNELK